MASRNEVGVLLVLPILRSLPLHDIDKLVRMHCSGVLNGFVNYVRTVDNRRI